MTIKPCEFKDGVCIHCGDDHVDTDCLGWVVSPPNPEVVRLENELLAATIRIENDAIRISEMAEQLDIQAGSIEAVQAANVRLTAELTEIRKQEPIYGRYHPSHPSTGGVTDVWVYCKGPGYMDAWSAQHGAVFEPLYLAPGAQGEKV